MQALVRLVPFDAQKKEQAKRVRLRKKFGVILIGHGIVYFLHSEKME